ncbi:glycogen synthase kinase-3 alpha [Anaeramoeba flamelloides]|nr:glycogen synthase kinase-3 alpha [Anaeramoeba flamelloides]
MKLVSHRNIIKMHDFFYTKGKVKTEDLDLHLVLEYVPKTIHQLNQYYMKKGETMPLIYVKVFMYQLLRAVAYLHRSNICHRDIKPQNITFFEETAELRLCDFGSAKVLSKNQKNVSYICSRYYRAPELMFGTMEYDTSIDLWSLGCVFAELLIGKPLFPGTTGLGQLVEIIKILGTPVKEEIYEWNPNYSNFTIPNIQPQQLDAVFNKNTPPEAIDLVSKFLKYSPKSRIRPLMACTHPFFDELRESSTVLPNNHKLPELFDFDEQELNSLETEDAKKLIPKNLIKRDRGNF